VLSVIIATDDSERALVATLAALVPGAAAGTVREVIVADGGSRDQTREVADIAGCSIMVLPSASRGARLNTAAATARAPWLMFLPPGAVPDIPWIGEVTRFVTDAERSGNSEHRVAVFRPTPADPLRPALVEAVALLRMALRTRPRPEQGLIISRRHYEALGGHRADHERPEDDLTRRIGRRRIVVLRCGVTALSV
jgi:hypothetical protein